MAKNGIVANYDDNGFPAGAAFTANVAFGGGVVKAAAGRILKVIVTTAFVTAGSMTIWDNASAGSGVPLLNIPLAAGVVGAVFDLNLPVFNGIFVNSTGITAGAVTIGYA